MVSEEEATEIVRAAAKGLGVPTPTIAFVPARISFMPVLAINGHVTITPAAREALSPEAIHFAVLHGSATNEIGGEAKRSGGGP